MKTTTKVIAAVLAVLMLSVVFAGAAAAAEQIGTVYVYEIYDEAQYNGTWYSTTGTETITFVPYSSTVSDAKTYIADSNVKEGVYEKGGYKIFVSYPYAPVSAYILVNGSDGVTEASDYQKGLGFDKVGTYRVTAFPNFKNTTNTSSDQLCPYNNTTSLYFTIANATSMPISGLMFTKPDGTESMFFGAKGKEGVNDYHFFGDSSKFESTSFSGILSTNVSGLWINGTTGDNYTSSLAEGTWKVRTVFKNSDDVNAKFVLPFDGDYYVSPLAHAFEFTVTGTKYKITAEKNEVIRGDDIVLTITGPIGADLNIEGPVGTKMDVNIGTGVIKQVSKGAEIDLNTETGDFKSVDFIDGKGNVTIKISKIGAKTTVQFKTTTDTKIGKYTFKIGEDKVTVKVVKGKVSLNVDTPSVYIGDKVTVSGTSTGAKKVYLYIEGGNKDLQQIPIVKEGSGTQTQGSDNKFLDPISVKEGAFTKTFTISNDFDAGTYTIYATADLLTVPDKVTGVVTKDTNYDSADKSLASLELKRPFITLNEISGHIASGSDITIAGTVEGSPKELAYWIFGHNKVLYGTFEPKDDGTYSKAVSTDENWAEGTYFVIVQHPMVDKHLNVKLNDDKKTVDVYYTNKDGKVSTTPSDTDSFAINTQQKEFAAMAVCDAIDKLQVDDRYKKEEFYLSAPFLTMDAITDVTQGTAEIKVSGTTNIQAGKEVRVAISSGSYDFTAMPKQDSSESGSSSGAAYIDVKIVEGSEYNTWSAVFIGEDLPVGEYVATAKTIAKPIKSVEDKFNIVAAEPTTEPTTEPTGQPTTAPTEQPTPASPGFGALIALAGLGAVALLVLRRN